MEKTFTINPKIAEKILESYKEFLSFNFGQSDEFIDRVLELINELDTEKLNLLLEQSFQASLKTEEGKHHNFSLVLSPPESKFDELLKNNWAGGYFDFVCTFEKLIDLNYLHKLAPAFESTNRKLRVWFNNNEMEIWGFASHFFDYFGLEIKSFSPGQLLVHIKPFDFPYKRFLITPTESKLVIDHVNLIELLFDEHLKDEQKEIPNADENNKKHWRYWFLLDVINKIMNHKHGGTLLFIRQEHSEEILEQSIESISYQPTGGDDFVERKLIQEENELVNLNRTAKEANYIAQTTAVDGATIINKNFKIIGFGAKIKTKKNSKDKLDEVWIREPFENYKEDSIRLDKLGGMRHQSTSQFVFDQREKDVFAIVASEDGKVSIMYWDRNKKMVTVMRHVEYLFYGMNI